MNSASYHPLAAIVTGMAYSGTTYMSRLLRLHPRVNSGFECGLLLADRPKDFPGVQPFYDWMVGTGPGNWQIKEEDMKSVCECSSWIEAYQKIILYSPLFRDKSDLVLDKTPAYIGQLDSILEKVAGVPCIVTRKDILPQYYSYKKRGFQLDYFIKVYVNCQESLERAVRKFQDRILMVDHQRLSTHTLEETKSVYEFVGLDAEAIGELDSKLQELSSKHAMKCEAAYSRESEIQAAESNVSAEEKKALADLPDVFRASKRNGARGNIQHSAFGIRHLAGRIRRWPLAGTWVASRRPLLEASSNVPQVAPPGGPSHAARYHYEPFDGRTTMNANADTYMELDQLGDLAPGYKPTYPFEGPFINEHHRHYAICDVREDILIDVGIDGWLRREDALKLYELAYYAEGDILELGCYRGLSTSIMAQAMDDRPQKPRFDSLDLSPSCVHATREVLRSRGLDEHVRLHCAEAARFCRQLVASGRRFGFVCIGHSHEYQPVLEACRELEELAVDGGFCLFHDYNDARNRDPNEPDYGVYQAVRAGLPRTTFTFYGIFGCTGLFRRNPRS
jgi:hypothetical protein